MTSSQFTNYLLSNRKRLALSQDEVAFLVGGKGGERISRYEKFSREPSLMTALAFEVIYKRSVSELFDGLYRQVEKEVAERAKILTHGNDRGSKKVAARKREILSALAKI